MSADPAAPEPQAPAAAPPASRRPSQAQELKTDLRWATPVLFFAILGLSGLLYGTWQGETAGTEELDQITDAIFSSGNYTPADEATRAAAGPARETGLIVPFEILSALLLAALIAGVVIALREREAEP